MNKIYISDMKVRIFTQPLGFNVGGILQNFALEKICNKFSNDVRTVNIPEFASVFFSVMKYAACVKRLFLKMFVNRKIIVRWWLEKKKIIVPQRNSIIYLDKCEDLIKLGDEDYIWIFGSDQIWRNGLTNDMKFYFGSFLNDAVPRIAYAASFGVDYWQFNKNETEKIIPLLKKFKAISVREESAVQLLKERGVDAQLVLDPTLLLQSDYYTSLETDVSRQFADDKHVFLYCLDKHPLQDEMIVLVNEKKKMSVMNIMANLQIDQWISGLRTADYVVTDSFHGTVFSILFHKKFIVVANEQRGLTRLQSLLKMFGLESRLIMSFEDFDCEKLDAEIDYVSVDAILNQEREKSLAFLSESLSS